MADEATSVVRIVLLKHTYQGGLEPAPGAALAQALGAITALGGEVTSADVVLGEWDYVVRCTGLDDVAMLRFAHHVAQGGLFETTTLTGLPATCLEQLEQPHAALAAMQPLRYKVP
jgi:uncharacterized protein with GYD domain